MQPKIFINIPVTDLKTSMEFYTRIGFQNNPVFTDDTAAAMVFSDTIFVMLLTHAKFSMFCSKPIVDTKNNASAIFALQAESPEAVNRIADHALAAGGKQFSEPKDYGFMMQRSFEDPDGHQWEVFYMDMDKFSESRK